MSDDVKKLTANLLKKDQRALSRLISISENQDLSALESLKELFSKVGRSKVIGITGPPGAGKSSLTANFIRFIREEGKTVAVIAVDPVSPFSGGALLGDRIRLTEHFTDPGVYIRSLSTRGKLGGLSYATRQAVHLCDAFGFDYIVVETVGVGQSEVDIRKIADLAILAVVPEWGDAVQTLKAGVLEIADLFVVNKSDREGAERLVQDLKAVLQMAGKTDSVVYSTSVLKEETVRHLFAEVKTHLQNTTHLEERRKSARVETVRELLLLQAMNEVNTWVNQNSKEVSNPYEFVLDFRKKSKGFLAQ